MTVTIKDVAKLANVAPSTVSRVIADNPRISEETKIRVRKAMEKLGYHPNLIARSLASKSTQSIGLVMPSSADKVFQNPFFPEVIRGISKGAHEKEYSLYWSTGETTDEIYEGVVQMVQGRRVDGLVLLYSRFDDEVVNYLQKNNFPFVVIGKPYKDIEQITHVDNDNFRASKEVTEYLIGLGHERIAFVGGSLSLVVTIDRLLGYETAIKNAGLPNRDEYISNEEFLKEGGQEAITELLSLSEPPTALVVADDLMALGVVNKLDEIGKVVPDDISVVSFNNVLLTEISRPPLTSVDINIFRLGYEAAKNLIEKVEDPQEPVKRIIIPHQLIKRQSCGEIEA
ncbi:LacI family DNA-binding transcriptional regulator [Fredinandcohnia quinoae]|uniref:LacI family DNA-binding transcriptional regulator n=1 Tax=Fredinandcohnia quinoae TaxID=2918902 RepID=A0AAW5E4H9_9BACI|nr:LacI family DNA-binding transcriptional regulator [Fredinandcohnia sp. SECRCQ15]MCH1626150.1 LacI family DNA-binding transcriptional regulator [Fredinandcohnia sp. SECRCQ15]